MLNGNGIIRNLSRGFGPVNSPLSTVDSHLKWDGIYHPNFERSLQLGIESAVVRGLWTVNP